MEWKHYWRNIVQRHQVVMEGWPSNIPFRNLSDASSSLSDLESLLRDWRSGKIHWKQITNRELQDLEQDRDIQIQNGEVDLPSGRRRRSDYGTKRTRKKGGKSRKEILSDEEQEDGEATGSVRKKRRKSRKETPSDDEDSDGTSPPVIPTNEV
jgi:hypothetical protein